MEWHEVFEATSKEIHGKNTLGAREGKKSSQRDRDAQAYVMRDLRSEQREWLAARLPHLECVEENVISCIHG